MVKQYPYIIQKNALINSNKVNGNYTPQSENWVMVSKCRNEDGKQRLFTVVESVHISANHLIQCPKGAEAISVGSKVRVINADNSVRLIGTVIYSEKKQMHTQIWVS